MGSAPDSLQNPERLAAPAETHLRIHAAKFQFTRDGMVFHAAFPIPIASEPADDAFGARLTKR